MSNPTADDFKNARLYAKNKELGNQIEHLEAQLSSAVDANRTLRDRNETLHRQAAELSRLAQDAKDQPDTIIAPGWGSDAKAAPLTMDSLREAWENAEVPTVDDPIREGDVVISPHYGGRMFNVFEFEEGRLKADAGDRVLHRAPQPEPWQALADKIRENSLAFDEFGNDITDTLAEGLHDDGVRVITEGDESNE